MTPDRDHRVQLAVWTSGDDDRITDVAGVLETQGFVVHALTRAPTTPQLLLLLPGAAEEDLSRVCMELAELYPMTPAVVFHTEASERRHPAIDHHVFELLPASLDAERLPEHLLAILSRWSRFEELKHSAAMLQQLESTIDLAYFDFKPETGTFRPSERLRELIGLAEPTEAMAPTLLLDAIHTADRAPFASRLFEAARTGEPFCLPVRLTDQDGRPRQLRVRGRAFSPRGMDAGARVFAVCEDHTEDFEQLAAAEARSRIDELTGLGNRRYFDDALTAALGRAQREDEMLALLYIDLDRFKLINDTLGHDAGDQLLRVISARLADVVRAEDVVCVDQEPAAREARVSRLGGDEFTVLLTGIHGHTDAELVADRMLAAIKEPTELAGQLHTPAASIGIALFPDDGTTPDELRKRADAALYAAKAAGGGYRFFLQSMEDGAVRRLSLENELRTAIAQDGLSLHYQPRIDYSTRRIIGAEALVRWSSPTLGRVSAEELIGIAEDAGLIVPLGRWVLREACLEASRWRKAGHARCRISVNVSPTQFEHDDVFTAVIDSLKAAELAPDDLDLEITESLLLRDEPEIGLALEELRRIGVRIALDDFGKGYSALAVLMSQPIDVLKLDKRLVETVAPDGEGSRLLANVIRMAHDLSMHPIAEGVAHADQADFLLKNGCAEMQGFFFSGALPPEAFRKLIAENDHSAV